MSAVWVFNSAALPLTPSCWSKQKPEPRRFSLANSNSVPTQPPLPVQPEPRQSPPTIQASTSSPTPEPKADCLPEPPSPAPQWILTTTLTRPYTANPSVRQRSSAREQSP